MLAEDDRGTALGDKPTEFGPEMAFVGCSSALPRRRERLTGAGAGPDRTILGPAGESEGEGPASDASEEVVLGIDKLFRINLLNPFADHGSVRKCVPRDQFAQPSAGGGIVVVVVDHTRRGWGCRAQTVGS